MVVCCGWELRPNGGEANGAGSAEDGDEVMGAGVGGEE